MSVNGDTQSSTSTLDTSIDEEKSVADEKKKTNRVLYAPPPLPEPMQTWRRVLKEVWLTDDDQVTKIELLRAVLAEIFVNVENPFEIALSIHKICPDYTVQKTNSLAGAVIREFGKWLEECCKQRDEIIERCLIEDLKIYAFSVAIAKHMVHLELFMRVFRLDDVTIRPKILSIVKELVRGSNYKNGLACAICFGLQDSFTIFDLAIPCMLLDRGPAVETYLQGHHEQQVEFIKFFDSLIGESPASVSETLSRWKIRGLPLSRFTGKTLEKLVAKLLTSMQITGDSTVAPRLTATRAEGSLRHLITKRFKEQSLSDANYVDFVEHAVSVRPELQRYLLTYLHKGQPNEALRWAVRLQIRLDDLPSSLVSYMQSHPDEVDRATSLWLSEKNSPDRDAEMELFPGYSIRVVDTWEAVLDIMNELEIAEEPVLIGLDCEWKPLFLCTHEQVALIQIATKVCVYLVDVVTLESLLSSDQWTLFFRFIFCSETIVKIGFDFANDLRVVTSTFPFMDSLNVESVNVVCLVKLVHNLLADKPDLRLILFPEQATKSGKFGFFLKQLIEALPDSSENFSYSSAAETGGLHFKLTDLHAKILGAPLDKSEQYGNWAMRPLRLEQKRYAAIDAHCLLLIYERLEKLARDLEVDWSNIVQMSLVGNKARDKKPKKPRPRIDEDVLNDMITRLNAKLAVVKGSPKRVTDVKMIADCMLLGVGKHLRRCGVDVLLPEDPRTFFKMASNENQRIILSFGKAYLQVF